GLVVLKDTVGKARSLSNAHLPLPLTMEYCYQAEGLQLLSAVSSYPLSTELFYRSISTQCSSPSLFCPAVEKWFGCEQHPGLAPVWSPSAPSCYLLLTAAGTDRTPACSPSPASS
ncbi:hypothetical protein JOQ06_009389, partial [Pogonophryne albipinna]